MLSMWLRLLTRKSLCLSVWLLCKKDRDNELVEGDSVAPGHARRRDGSGDACRGAMRVLVREERVR